MKKLFAISILTLAFAQAFGNELKLITSVTASVDKVGAAELPGLLLKFGLPAELQNAQIDFAILRFEVEPDSGRRSYGLLVRPMLSSWSSGRRLSVLGDSAASPHHVNFGRISFESGRGEIQITQAVRAWQEGGLENFGLLVYPAGKRNVTLTPKSLPSGGVAELEIFYTPEEKPAEKEPEK